MYLVTMQSFNSHLFSARPVKNSQRTLSDLISGLQMSEIDVPEVTANIGEQMAHMDLTTMPLPASHLVTKISQTIAPKDVLEVGAGIGHLSSWLLHTWSESSSPPKRYMLVESGSKFCVILNRVVERFGAGSWSQIVNADWCEWVEENNVKAGFDLAVVDVGWEKQTDCLMAPLPLMAKDGLLITLEPDLPLEDETDSEKIAAFNGWITLVRMMNETHELSFVPTGGATLLLVRRK